MGARIPVAAHQSTVEVVQALRADRVFVQPGRFYNAGRRPVMLEGD